MLKIGHISILINTTRTASFLLFGIISFTISLLFIHLGSIGWPGLHWDAALYGTPVINVASGKGWIFGGYAPQVTLRPTNTYNFHGILHAFVYGSLFGSSTWARYIFTQSIINAVTFFIYSIFYVWLLVKSYGIKFYCFVIALLLSSIVGIVCIGLQGRPEQLAPLLLALPLASLLLLSRKIHLAIALCLSISLLIILSPLLGIFFAVMVLFYLYGSSHNMLVLLGTSIAVLGSAFLISLILISIISPISPLEWYVNVFGVSQSSGNFSGLLLRIRENRWGATMIVPVWNILVVSAITTGGVWVWRSKRNLLSIILFALLAIFFNEVMCDYSYLSFIPFSLALCLCNSSRIFSLYSRGQSLRLVKFAVLIICTFYIYVLASYLLVPLIVPRSELSAADALRSFSVTPAGKALASGSSAVGFPALSTPSMVILGDAGEKFVSFNPSLGRSSDASVTEYEGKTGNKVTWMVYPQTATKANINPPANIYIGSCQFTLVDSNWVSPRSADFLFRPAHLTNRYNFAIYRRQS